MKYRENIRKKMDFKAKAIIIASLIVCFFVILVPVWQKGVTRKDQYSLIFARERLERIEEEERNLVAFILESGKAGENAEELLAGV